MLTNLDDITRALDILEHADLSGGRDSDNRVLVALTANLSQRQLKLLTPEEQEQVKKGNPGMMKKLLGKTVWTIARRQASNILGDLATHLMGKRRTVKPTEKQLIMIVNASKGEFGSGGHKDRRTRQLRVLNVILELAIALDALEAKAEKREPWQRKSLDMSGARVAIEASTGS